jgi:hypothetical protein
MFHERRGQWLNSSNPADDLRGHAIAIENGPQVSKLAGRSVV